MQITSTMLERLLTLSEQARVEMITIFAEQMKIAEHERAQDRERKARKKAEKQRNSGDRSTENHRKETGIPVEIQGNPAEIRETTSRVDNLSSLSESIERVREESPPIVPPANSEPPFFDAFWGAYPKRAGSRDRKAAVKAFRAATKRAAPAVIIEGALQYANYCRLSDKEGTELVRQARTWLNADGWTETYETSRSNPNGSHRNWSIASAVLAEQDRREGVCREDGEDDVFPLP